MCEPKPGAFVPFADPDKNALEAEVFWRAKDFHRVVSAYIRHGRDVGFGGIISLEEVRCRKTLLKAVDGEQHLLFRDRCRVAQVRCVGADILAKPFALELVVDGFPEIDAYHRLVRRLADIYRNRTVGSPQGRWTVEATRHRDALAALDLRAFGWSYREIAIFLHGARAVREDWTNPNQSMKNRVIRSVKRGFRLMNGGYRTLLV